MDIDTERSHNEIDTMWVMIVNKIIVYLRVYTQHYLNPWQCYVGLTIFHGGFPTFRLMYGNIPRTIANPVEHYHGYE